MQAVVSGVVEFFWSLFERARTGDGGGGDGGGGLGGGGLGGGGNGGSGNGGG